LLFQGATGGQESARYPRFVKIGSANLYIGVNKRGAVAVQMDTITGGGTIIDSIEFAAPVRNSGAVIQQLVYPTQADTNLVELVGFFSNGGGPLPNNFTLSVGFDLVTDTFVQPEGLPVDISQNVSAGPPVVVQLAGAIKPTEIWNLWQTGGATSGAQYGLNAVKVIR
jgi:hypothetical protein